MITNKVEISTSLVKKVRLYFQYPSTASFFQKNAENCLHLINIYYLCSRKMPL